MKTVVTFYMLYGVLLFQVCTADSDSKSSSNSSEASEKDDTLIEDEFTIINECTRIPSTMNDLIADYINVRPQNGDEVLTRAKLKIFVLGREIATMRARVKKHSELFGPTNPDVQLLEQEIHSTLDVVESLARKLQLGIRNSAEKGDTTESVYEKIRYIETAIEPTIATLERICIAQTQDILKNVFDYNEEN